MTVLLSIKPDYVEKILDGSKKYEFRKIIFNDNIQRIMIYSSSPVKKIVGFFRRGQIIEDCCNISHFLFILNISTAISEVMR